MVAPDGFGGALIAWVESNFPEAYLDILAQRILPDGSIAPGWPKTGVPVSLALDYQSLRDIVADGTGGMYLSWTDFRNGGFGHADVYVSRITADGRLADGWTPDGNRLVDLPGTRAAPYLLGDPSGDVFVTWGDSRLATALGGTFYVTRLTPAGTVAPGWPADGVPLFLSGTGSEYQNIVSDGAGGAFIGWNDNRRGGGSRSIPYDYDIYAQHVLADGSLDARWPRDGAPICTAPDGQYAFTMAPDGAGGALFAWEDRRNEVYWQAYAQRISPDGSRAPGWPLDGVPLSSFAGFQNYPQVVGDGAGGLYAFWNQLSNGNKVIGQHLLSNGQRASGWLEEGLPIGAGDCSCAEPRVVSDDRGGALLAYIRGTVSTELIYAQRITGDGPVATLLSLVDADISGHSVTLRWHSAEAARLRSTVERRTAGSEDWSMRDTPELVGTDVLVFTDSNVPSGRYDYRLRYFDGATEVLSEIATVEVLATTGLAFAGFRPNPAIGSATVAFSLPDARPARLDVIDVKGRVVHSREVGSLGGGSHVLLLARETPLGPGMYWIRLTHPERTLTTKGLVVR